MAEVQEFTHNELELGRRRVKKQDAEEEVILTGLKQGTNLFISMIAMKAREAWIKRTKKGEGILLEGEEDWQMEKEKPNIKKDKSRMRPILEEDQEEIFRKKVEEKVKCRLEEILGMQMTTKTTNLPEQVLKQQ
jgi:hypothetical protein